MFVLNLTMKNLLILFIFPFLIGCKPFFKKETLILEPSIDYFTVIKNFENNSSDFFNIKENLSLGLVLKEREHSDFYIWVEAYSKNKISNIKINKIIFQIENNVIYEKNLDKNILVNQLINDKNINFSTKIYKNGNEDIVFILSKNDWNKISKDNFAILEIFYKSSDAKEIKSKKFKIKRYKYYDISWST